MPKEDAQNPNGEQQKPEMLSDMTFPPIGEEEQQTAAEGGEQNDLAARLQAIEERFEKEQQAFAEERKSWQQTVDRLIQQQAAPRHAPAEPQQPQGVDFNDLPDPVDKPEDFKRALAEKFQKTLQAQQQAQQQQASQQQSVSQQLDALWERFKSEHADLAGKTITLQGAIVAERNDMQMRGIDPQQGILSDPDGFMRRIADRMRSELGTTTQNDPPPAPGSQQTTQQPANRTGGIAGGTSVNGSGKGKGKEPPGFLAQLKQSQLDSGLI